MTKKSLNLNLSPITFLKMELDILFELYIKYDDYSIKKKILYIS